MDMLEGRCDCGELLMTFHPKLTGTVLVHCPECGENNHWQSSVSWDQMTIPEPEEITDETG